MMAFLKKNILAILLLVIPLSVMSAQGGAAKGNESDPKAKALLDKVKRQYDTYQSLETNITISLKLAEQKKEEVQKGKAYQEKDKYRLEMAKNWIISDGSSVWTKVDEKTVHLSNATGKSNGCEIKSPKDLMEIYEKNGFSYTIMGESAEGWSKKSTMIVFKPTKRNCDYTQIRVAIDQKTNYVVSIEAFGRDQSRYKCTMEQPSVNKKYTADFFTFDKTKYPNMKVEDMRID